MNDLIQVEARVAERLDEYRMAHTRSVKEECLRLAKLFALSQQDTALLAEAALLHDSTKALQIAEQATLAQILGIELTRDDLDSPATLHAITGAAMARVDFNAPHAVTAAIACHTTGKPGMTTFDKILYLADYMEPNRDFDGVEEMRRLVFEDLDKAMIMGLEMNVEDLTQRGVPVHKNTQGTLDELRGRSQ